VKREKQNESTEPAQSERTELPDPPRGGGETNKREECEALEREQNKFFIQSQRGDTDCTCNHRE